MKIENVNVKFNDLTVFNDQNFEFYDGKINCITGPSGCGKTTLLNYIAGLLNKRRITEDIGYIFQEPRLLPWMTVMKNITLFIPENYSKTEKKDMAENILNQVGLSDFAGYYPDKLSGGMRHRVSIARAFCCPCSLLLMDEPFAGQDLKNKNELITLFLKLWEKDKKTVIAVTHDFSEIWRIGDSITVLSPLPAEILLKEKVEISHNMRENLEFSELKTETERRVREILLKV